MSKTRGRPLGSTSFVRVKLSDLNHYLREEATIPVSKKYLEEMGLTAEESSVIIPAQPKESNIPEFKVTTFS